MKVEIWSDVVCPWCYIGKRRFEAALARFPHAGDVDVVWRSFELDPTTVSAVATEEGLGHADLIAAKYGMSREQADAAIASMTRAAAGEGLDFHLEDSVRSNTFDAHRILHLAREHGLQDAVEERLMRAYFTEGLPVGDPATLAGLAAEAGLDRSEVERVLAGADHADAVRADQAEARALGISGVPFFVVDRKYGVSGAQPTDQLLMVLERAWGERTPLTMVGAPVQGGDGSRAADEACGPEGCAL